MIGDLNKVLQVGLDGIGGTTSVSQFALTPCDVTVTSCAFNAPAGFAFSPDGDMYVTDSGARVLKIPSTHVSSKHANDPAAVHRTCEPHRDRARWRR